MGSQAEYFNNGYTVVDLPNLPALQFVRDALVKRLKELGCTGSLDGYHIDVSDDAHDVVQWDLVQWFWSWAVLPLVQPQLDLFRDWLGPDIKVQRRPHLRIARPRKNEDNIGFHRDTAYGQSPYSMSVHIPFVYLPEDACLLFCAGSHLRPDSAFTWETGEGPPKGSPKHQMGFPYKPRWILGAWMEPVPLRFGQAVIFHPATVHGQDVNYGKGTRWSVDIRLINSWHQSADPEKYMDLAESVVTSAGRRFTQV